MNGIQQNVQRFNLSRWRTVDPASLQFRLTVIIALASLLGLGGLSIWTSWKMQQMMFTTHSQDLKQISDQWPRARSAQPSSLFDPQALQSVVDRWSSSERWVWVRQSNGRVLAQPSTLPTPGIRTTVANWNRQSLEPRIDSFGGRYVVWCSMPWANGSQIDYLYIAHDVTNDYVMWLTLIRNLGIGTVAASTVLTIASSIMIRRSLASLRQTCEWAAANGSVDSDVGRPDPNQLPSEIKELASTLNSLMEQVNRTGEQQRQFANGVSHELRTPLSVVYGYLQSILRRGSNLTEQQKEALEIATSETERTIHLLQDLLDLARAECKTIQFNLQPTAVDDVVSTVLTGTDTFHSHRISVEAPPQSLWAIADRDYLSQVLSHLLHNAIQFSSPQAPITLRLRQHQATVLIEVCDRGCGIAADQQTRIFEPFYRVDPSRARTTGGVGLGLAIARSLVVGMGGRISVASTPNYGSTFTVQLPISEAVAQATPLN